MKRLEYRQVDVFAREPFAGNPVAVFLDAEGLTAERMQRITAWMNLSECTFVLPPTHPEADYRVRIFDPRSEMRFAGHPTLGTARALLDAGLVPKRPGRLVQECGAGLVEITIEDDLLFFRLPEPRASALGEADRARLAAALGLPREELTSLERVDVGPIWITGRVPSAGRLLALRPDLGTVARLSEELGVDGVTLYGERGGPGPAIEVRSFAPSAGIAEDPVCGSGNGCVAHLVRTAGAPYGSSYVARQGAVLGRDGEVHVRLGADAIRVGGVATVRLAGVLREASG